MSSTFTWRAGLTVLVGWALCETPRGAASLYPMMKKIQTLVLLVGTVVALAAGAGCSKKTGGDSHGHHHHTAPHGGTLVELGDHQFNLEFVRDAATGTLTAYVLDGHAEKFIRISLPIIPVTATVGGVPQPLALKATANAATGEMIGDTSQFVAQADWLKTTDTFTVTIPALEVRGARFADVTFNFPKGSNDHGH